MKDHRLEKDLEANRAMPEPKTALTEMAHITPLGDPNGIRTTVQPDLEFVDVDLRDPVIRSQSVYTKIRNSISRSSVGSRSRSRARGREV